MTPLQIQQIIQSISSTQDVHDMDDVSAHTDLTQTQVYIGLNDAETKQQKHETERYVSMLKRVCIEYGVPFSFDVINGGYIHDNGEYTEEKTIELTFIDVQQDIIDQIASDLCTFFRQESVLVTTGCVRARTIHAPGID